MTLTLLFWGWLISKDYLFQRCPSVRTSRRWRTPWPLRTDTPRPTWWSAPRPSTRNTIILTFLEDNYTIYNLDRHKIISCGLDRYSIRLKTYSLNMVTACDRSGIPKFIPNACTLLCLTLLSCHSHSYSSHLHYWIVLLPIRNCGGGILENKENV